MNSSGRHDKASATLELLSVEEMYKADALAIASGTPGTELMDHAGRAVANAAAEMCASGRVVVLCGPGNNGGDGFIAAKSLAEREPSNWSLDVQLLGGIDALKGDAKWAADCWMNVPNAAVRAFDPQAVRSADLVIDAVFGAGLGRPIDGPVAEVLEAVNENDRCAVLSVDVPSGIDGNTGQVRGYALKADRTVTFFRKKPGHYLMPGRRLCGRVDCVDIGIEDRHLKTIGCRTYANAPKLWEEAFPTQNAESHKYKKGHALIVAGGVGKTGAARLAAMAALRAEAGLVTVAGGPTVLPELAAQLTTVMTVEVDQAEALAAVLRDERKNAIVIGPGLGVGGVTRDYVAAVLSSAHATVLDADALSSFEGRQEALFDMIKGAAVLTPHEGEFQRIFPGLLDTGMGRLAAARDAAQRSGATIVLKGPDTVIASPDGRAAINANAPASLATAGSGDVLAGTIGGLMAQGMAPWEGACAAVWLHGAAAQSGGRGMIAEDLPGLLPAALSALSAELAT